MVRRVLWVRLGGFNPCLARTTFSEMTCRRTLIRSCDTHQTFFRLAHYWQVEHDRLGSTTTAATAVAATSTTSRGETTSVTATGTHHPALSHVVLGAVVVVEDFADAVQEGPTPVVVQLRLLLVGVPGSHLFFDGVRGVKKNPSRMVVLLPATAAVASKRR